MASRIGALLHRDPFCDGWVAVKTEDNSGTSPADTDADAATAYEIPRFPDPPPAAVVTMGGLVIVYEGFNKQKAVVLTPKGVYQNRYGSFPHAGWVGQAFGAKVFGKDGRGGGGFVWLLAPTPELWTKVLPHRTQILYAPDISLVTLGLELKPGCVVCESGTGSASLTHALVRAVAPTGHVYTFEFNQARAEAADCEMKEHELGKFCTVTHRDVEKDGFPECLQGRCDAVFLDLPGPWKVVPSAARSLRPDGVLCAFSPCIEQVQKTASALELAGFGDCQTVELLGREYDVEQRELMKDLSEQQPRLNNKWQREAKHKAKRKRTGGDGDVWDGGDDEKNDEKNEDAPKTTVVAYPRQQAQSHTGYLTFARLVPYVTADVAATARAIGAAKRGGRRGGDENDDEYSD